MLWYRYSRDSEDMVLCIRWFKTIPLSIALSERLPHLGRPAARTESQRPSLLFRVRFARVSLHLRLSDDASELLDAMAQTSASPLLDGIPARRPKGVGDIPVPHQGELVRLELLPLHLAHALDAESVETRVRPAMMRDRQQRRRGPTNLTEAWIVDVRSREPQRRSWVSEVEGACNSTLEKRKGADVSEGTRWA